MKTPLLAIKNLTVEVRDEGKIKRLVDQANLILQEEMILALVGGSGSGKTTTGLSILRLLPAALSITSGEILFEGQNILEYSPLEIQKLRGKKIGMVFQEPLYAFNPVFRIGEQIDELLRVHTTLNAVQRKNKILELLNLVEIADPLRVFQSYPHQLSGGMRQRAMIAQAIAAEPRLIIADEPTSNLDVTLQARIMELFRQLRKKMTLSILLITHDLGMVSHLADEVVVMNAGQMVEHGRVNDVMTHPQHAYTKRLVSI